MPWNENGNKPSGSNNNSPWGSNGSKRPSGGGQGGPGGQGPDLEEQFKRMRERFAGGGPKRGAGGAGGLGPAGFVIVFTIALLVWLSTGVYTVDAGEKAVVKRFGQYTNTQGSGLHFHFPVPIETHIIKNVTNINTVNIGQVSEESEMLTGDENIAHVEFAVFWQISSAENYLFNVRNPESTVKQVAESAMREIVGKSQLENLINTERDIVADKAKLLIQETLDEYEAGIIVTQVNMERVDAPDQVAGAFKDLKTAEQDAQTSKNEAERYRNQVVPQAEGQAAELIQQAEAYREAQISIATGEADRFTAIYAEYEKAPEVTRERMHLETMEKVLANSQKMILDGEAGAVPYLPLDRLNRNSGGQ